MSGRIGSVALFVACFCLIISMYGGGFSTVPAYLRDLFGTAQVGAIHGRLLTAWSAAGLAGPLLVNYIREYQIEARHLDPAESYTFTMYLMAGLLVAGFVCNFLVRPLIAKPLASSEEVDEGFRSLRRNMSDHASAESSAKPGGGILVLLVLSWLWVGIPLAWGVSKTVGNSLALFSGPVPAATK
jgi:hypothetical protein